MDDDNDGVGIDNEGLDCCCLFLSFRDANSLCSSDSVEELLAVVAVDGGLDSMRPLPDSSNDLG